MRNTGKTIDGWTLVVEDGIGRAFGENHKEFLLSDEAVSSLSEPEGFGIIAPGSLAYTADLNNAFMKNSDEEWVAIIGGDLE